MVETIKVPATYYSPRSYYHRLSAFTGYSFPPAILSNLYPRATGFSERN